jgi:hypothetical protein
MKASYGEVTAKAEPLKDQLQMMAQKNQLKD